MSKEMSKSGEPIPKDAGQSEFWQVDDEFFSQVLQLELKLRQLLGFSIFSATTYHLTLVVGNSPSKSS
jgi:hypothetical protein